VSTVRSTAVSVLAALAVAGVAPASANEVLRWNQVANETSAAANTDPLTESRVFAILHLAVHDALNAVESRFESYGEPFAAAKPASAEAAAAGAAHAVLTALLPASGAAFDAARDRELARVADGAARRNGLEAGRRAAEAILAARRTDGADATTPYQPGTRPGDYRPTPPDFTPAFLTHWGRVRPFALETSAQFRPEAPPAPGSERARQEMGELERVGGQARFERTEEQSEIARFWYENSTQGWNRIAREVAATRGLDAWESGRLLALVNVAMADGFIAGFEAKYHFNYWRPATALRENGAPDWLSYLGTPPVPDHPSTHTVLGAAAAAVLARSFGTDLVSFSTTSGAPYPGITRRFWSFSEAARENGASRILAGIHFPSAVEAGYRQGDAVGAWAFERILRPRSEQRAAKR
jgi:hypothetical protein